MNSPHGMMLRSFIAVEIPTEILQVIAQSTSALQNSLPKPLIRWVNPKNIHLTLQFLGDVLPPNLERLAVALEQEVGTHPVFELIVVKIGAFPTSRRARILWVGLEAPKTLTLLQQAVVAVTTQLGFHSEGARFTPHLTIGRVNQNITQEGLQRIDSILQKTELGVLGRFLVEAIHIVHSNLLPTGPVYTPLYSLPLNQKISS